MFEESQLGPQDFWDKEILETLEIIERTKQLTGVPWYQNTEWLKQLPEKSLSLNMDLMILQQTKGEKLELVCAQVEQLIQLAEQVKINPNIVNKLKEIHLFFLRVITESEGSRAEK